MKLAAEACTPDLHIVSAGHYSVQRPSRKRAEHIRLAMKEWIKFHAVENQSGKIERDLAELGGRRDCC
jgi:hypothetical protein